MRSSLESDPVPYTSDAFVLLSGLGSDELLGGYGRHRSTFNSGGWPAVVEEVLCQSLRRNIHDADQLVVAT